MLPRLLPLFLAGALLAEAPRPRPGFEGWDVRLHLATASGTAAADRSAGVELTGNFPLTQAGAWRCDWGFRAAAVHHDWANAPLDFTWVRGVSFNISGYAVPAAGRTRYAVVQLDADAATGASFGDALTAQFLYGADWSPSETFTCGYLFLAETRAVRSPLVLVAPTFRWRFAEGWAVGTGRKSLVLERRFAEGWRAAFTLAFLQEEARLADLGGLAQAYEAERVAAVLSLGRTAAGRSDEVSLGWAFRARARLRQGGVESKLDLAPGALFSLASRWRF